jgi:predicted SnoaL-like aldol condensation-catalyzing enzyme
MSNKDIVVAFWTQVFQDKDPAGAAAAYLGETYIQHNPNATDGASGLIEFAAVLAEREPNVTAEIVRVVAEGDLVATHSKFIYSSATVAAMDFWRLDTNGKIVEHWDSIQPVPPTSRNDNGMF